MVRQSSQSFTPLMRAAAVGHVGVVHELLEEGRLDVNERGPRDSTALMFAAGGGHTDVVRALIKEGADVEAQEEGGWTALQLAEEDGHYDIVTLLRGVTGSLNLRQQAY